MLLALNTQTHILFLFLLDASESCEGFDLTGTFGSSIFPKTLGPVNFLASAFIVSEGSTLFSLTGSAFFISVFTLRSSHQQLCIYRDMSYSKT